MMLTPSDGGHPVEAQLNEERTFPPPAEFVDRSNVTSPALYQAGEDTEKYWAAEASSLVWHKPWRQTLDWSEAPFAKWFVGGTLNVSENCLDRHLDKRGDRLITGRVSRVTDGL